MKGIAVTDYLYNTIVNSSKCTIGLLLDDMPKVKDPYLFFVPRINTANFTQKSVVRYVVNVIECEPLTMDDLYVRLELSSVG